MEEAWIAIGLWVAFAGAVIFGLYVLFLIEDRDDRKYGAWERRFHESAVKQDTDEEG